MRSKNSLVSIVFLIGFALAAWLFAKVSSSLFLQLGIANTAILGESFTLSTLFGVLVGGGVIAFLYTKESTRVFVEEVILELKKVAWPTKQETSSGTVVVIVFSFIAAGVLGVFDSFFGWLTQNNFFLY